MPRAASTANNFGCAAWQRLPKGNPARLDPALSWFRPVSARRLLHKSRNGPSSGDQYEYNDWRRVLFKVMVWTAPWLWLTPLRRYHIDWCVQVSRCWLHADLGRQNRRGSSELPRSFGLVQSSVHSHTLPCT